MRTRPMASILMAALIVASTHAAWGGPPGPPLPPPPPVLLPPPPPAPGVNVSVSGFLPPPPGVHVYYDAGRPYYIERERRIYLKRRGPKHHPPKHYRHHEDHGRKVGHHKH